MNVQFDWQFDKEFNDEEKKLTKPRDRIQSSLTVHRLTLSRVRSGTVRRQMWPTNNQRRLLSSMARMRPWLCPAAEPEPFVCKTSRLGKRTLESSARWRTCYRQTGAATGLTRRQRRLHAALARTRPWLCPSVWPE
jgi:hypothetical protein